MSHQEDMVIFAQQLKRVLGLPLYEQVMRIASQREQYREEIIKQAISEFLLARGFPPAVDFAVILDLEKSAGTIF